MVGQLRCVASNLPERNARGLPPCSRTPPHACVEASVTRCTGSESRKAARWTGSAKKDRMRSKVVGDAMEMVSRGIVPRKVGKGEGQLRVLRKELSAVADKIQEGEDVLQPGRVGPDAVPSHVMPQVRDLGQMELALPEPNPEAGGTKEGEGLSCPGNDVGRRVGPDYAVVYKGTAEGTGGEKGEIHHPLECGGRVFEPEGRHYPLVEPSGTDKGGLVAVLHGYGATCKAESMSNST